MFYIKTNISDNVEIKVDLYEDEIYTQCPKCGKEIQIEAEEIADIVREQGLASTSVYCEECSKEVKNANQKTNNNI